MPCPPSYEELEFMRMDNEWAAIDPSIKLMKSLIPEAKNFLEVLKSQSLPYLSEFKRVELAKNIDQPMASDPPFFTQPDNYPDNNDIERFKKFIKELNAQCNSLELQLCILCDLVMNVWKSIPDKQRPSDFVNTYMTLRQYHEKHRLADQEEAIKNLKLRASYLKDLTPEKTEIDKQIEKITSYTLEEIIHDRNLF
jgi:hypothetical protein